MSQEIQIFYPNIVLQEDIYALLINFSKIHSHRFSLFFPIFRKSYYYNRVVVELLFSLAHRYKSRTRKSFYLLSHPTTNKIQTLSPIFVNKFLGLVSHYNHPAQYKSGLPDKATKVEGHLNADVRMVENLKAVDLSIC